MARQRFIWPSIWDDPDLGRLSSDARLLYIGCFSLADDDGRIIGDPVYLKTQVFRYTDVELDQVAAMRDEIASVCRNFVIYNAHGVDYIAFLNWSEFQKPKYPKPSKLPPPPRRKRAQPKRSSQKSSGNDSGSGSGNDSPAIPETIPPQFPHRVGMGWDGLGRDGLDKNPSFLPSPATDGTEGRIFEFDKILGDVA